MKSKRVVDFFAARRSEFVDEEVRDRALAALPVIGRLVQRQRSTAASSDEDDVYQLLDGAIPIDVRRFFAWRLSPGPAGFSFLGAPHSFSVFFLR